MIVRRTDDDDDDDDNDETQVQRSFSADHNPEGGSRAGTCSQQLAIPARLGRLTIFLRSCATSRACFSTPDYGRNPAIAPRSHTLIHKYPAVTILGFTLPYQCTLQQKLKTAVAALTLLTCSSIRPLATAVEEAQKTKTFGKRKWRRAYIQPVRRFSAGEK